MANARRERFTANINIPIRRKMHPIEIKKGIKKHFLRLFKKEEYVHATLDGIDQAITVDKADWLERDLHMKFLKH